mmetsp:Transcript_73775/g.203665  ORF Transcript_73775/g.203665 Transcript_73775/m.203665 type:complete len:204 (+) Transcript_73775:23-634(+)
MVVDTTIGSQLQLPQGTSARLASPPRSLVALLWCLLCSTRLPISGLLRNCALLLCACGPGKGLAAEPDVLLEALDACQGDGGEPGRVLLVLLEAMALQHLECPRHKVTADQVQECVASVEQAAPANWQVEKVECALQAKLLELAHQLLLLVAARNVADHDCRRGRRQEVMPLILRVVRAASWQHACWLASKVRRKSFGVVPRA